MFLTDTNKYKEAVEETKYLSNFKNFLCSRAYQFEPKYFVTMFYGRNSEGGFLAKGDYRKRWDLTEIGKHTDLSDQRLNNVLVTSQWYL